jgi:integrase
MRKRHSADKSPHVERDYLRPHEAKAVIEAAGRVGRQRLRDQVLLRLMYRHGLRASEARHTKWTDFDLTPGSGPKTFHVRRLKGSNDSVHTLDRDEVSALRRLKAGRTSPFVFLSERGGPLSPDMIARIVERAAETAKLGFHVHPFLAATALAEL